MADEKQKSWRQRVGGLAGFVIGGGVVGYFGGSMIAGMFDAGAAPALDLSLVVAVAIGAIYLMLAGMVGLGVIFPKWGARTFDDGDVEEFIRQRSLLMGSCLGTLCFGAALILAALAEHFGLAPAIAAIGFFGLMIAGIAIFWPFRHGMDELDWKLSDEASVWSLYGIAGIGGSWAACAHFGLVSGPAMLDWLSMFWGISLLMIFVALGRRGMIE